MVKLACLVKIKMAYFWVERGERELVFELVDGIEVGVSGGMSGGERAAVLVGFDDFVVEADLLDKVDDVDFVHADERAE